MTIHRPHVELAFWIIILLLLFSVFSSSPDSAGREVGTEKILELDIRGNELVPDARITDRLGIETGMEISPHEIRQRIQSINDFGGFGRFEYNLASRREGTIVTLFLDEQVALEAIEFRGNSKVADRELMRNVTLSPGQLIDYNAVQDARERILEHYREKGYELAAVELSGRFGTAEGELSLIFDIAEGRELRVRRINFAGNKEFSRNRLRRIMDTHVYLRIPFIRKGRFDPDTFYSDLDRIEEKYFESGYLDARVGGYWTYTDGFTGYELNIIIYEGLRYEINEIEIQGNRLFRDEELLQEIGLKTGRLFTPGDREKIAGEISRLYAKQGLIDVTMQKDNLSVQPLFDAEEGHVDVVINISETHPVYVRRIRVEGLTKTDELVVLRHLRFAPGDRIDQAKFEASERALIDTGYFDLSHPRAVHISVEPGDERFRDVIVNVKEGQTGNLMIGGGVSSDAGFMGNLSITEKNFDIKNWPRSWSDFRYKSPFRGGGQQVSLVLNVGRDRSDFEISFREPRIGHTDYSFGTRLYSRYNRWDFYDLIKAGGGVTFGRRLGDHVYQQIGLGLEHIHVTGMADTAPRAIARYDDTYLRPYIDLSLKRDTRDSTMFPTSGYVARLNSELSMKDIKMMKLTANAAHYWPTYVAKNNWKHVFMLRAEVGVMRAYGSDRTIPVFERFYGGGLGSVRGFQWHGMSPVESEQQEQIGGRSKLMGTAEYTIPLFTEHFRIALFADAGYVQESVNDVFDGWDELRVSSGGGIRWLMPALGGIPLTLDYAFPLEKEDYDITQHWHFNLGIGQGF